MPEFSCRIATIAGEVSQRTFVSTDESTLRRELEAQDLLLLDLRRKNPALQGLLRTMHIRPRIASRDFLFFNQELRALIKAGLPIVPSLDILLERRKHKVFRAALIDVRDRVKAGESLSDAFVAQGELFPKLYGAALASGERSGELASVIERYIAYQRNVLALRRKVVSALVYPAVLMTMSFVLILLMVFVIIPKFKTFLTEFGTDLPWITQAILTISLTARSQAIPLFAAAVISLGTFLWWQRTDRGRLAVDGFKLKIPIVGRVIHDYAQNRFTRTLGTLQAGGIPLVVSLELSARAVGHAVFERDLLRVTERVREGQSLWESLDQTGLLSDIAVQMIKVGESTGAMDEMLKSASDFTDEEIDAQLTRMMALFEPLMLVFIAVVVAVMLLSVYYPLIQLYGKTTM